MQLTKEELSRYNRQIMIDGFGKKAQIRLKKAKVGIIGLGGLGSIICIYLTVVGVGKLVIVDKDNVKITDLNRQILYYNEDIGKYKVDLAKKRLKKFNPEVEIITYKENVTEKNINEIFKDVDCLIDALDNVESRLILNQFAVEKNLPLFHGAIYGMQGWVTTIIPIKTVCLACIYDKIPKQETIPVIGVTPALIGIIQSTEVIKYFTKIGNLLLNKLLIYDAKGIKFEEVELKRNINCKVCHRM